MTANSGSELDSSILVLASASPRRRELLRQIGIAFATLVPDVDETPAADESVEDFVVRLAIQKAQQGMALARKQGRRMLPVLGADTSITLDGEILGKPVNREHGTAMLARLAGRTHEVLTAVALVSEGKVQQRISRSRVTFAPMTGDEIAAYWETGESVDKAGSYAIQGKAGAFIEHIEGSYSGIVGLPLFEVGLMLKNLGIRL